MIAWLYLHREFWCGVLIGSLAELALVYVSRWTWDRVMMERMWAHRAEASLIMGSSTTRK